MPFGQIHVAANQGNLEEVMRLVEENPQEVYRQAACGWTALHTAKEAEVMTYLLDHGASINQTDNWNTTPLWLACSRGLEGVVELLLGRGGDPTISTTANGPQRYNDGQTCLMEAAAGGHVGAVRCLLRHQPAIPLDIRNNNRGATALWLASCRGHSEVLSILLEAGADLTLSDKEGRTPMDIAEQNGHESCVKLLQEWDRPCLLMKARRIYDARTTTTVPMYLRRRVERAEALPEVMVVKAGDGDVVGSVLEYVVCGGLVGSLFVELMETMGRAGVREE